MHQSSATEPEARQLIDLERYPILDPTSDAGCALLDTCRAQLAELGACELPGFLRPEATARMAREAALAAPRAHRHAGKATPYLELPDPSCPEDHPRRLFDTFSLGAIAYDHIPAHHALRVLYEWDGLLGFLAAVLQVAEIHRYADPLGACNVAVMVDGDCLEWHFDQTDTMPMTPGTRLLFQGRHSIQRVTPVRGETPRLVALLAYDTRPGTCASELLQRARYGRALRPGA